jgi:hypothetical protein
VSDPAITFLNLVRGGLLEAEREIADKMGRGVCKDFPEYRAMAGEIRGLSAARVILDDIAKMTVDFDE